MKHFLHERICICKKKKDSGAAMIIAIIVSMVVFAFSLSLLLVSYSLFYSTNRKLTEVQCREIAKSLSVELGNEITGVSYASYNEQINANRYNKDMLWQYIRYNVCQDTWPYYDESGEDSGHDEESAYRYFELYYDRYNKSDTSFNDGMCDVSILIYWTGEDYKYDKESVRLYVKVSCTKGDYTSVITSVYSLTCSEYENENTTVKNDEPVDDTNPSDNSIKKIEKWSWKLVERE